MEVGFLVLYILLVTYIISSLNGRKFLLTSTVDFTFVVEPFYCRVDYVLSRIELPDGSFTVAREAAFSQTAVDLILAFFLTTSLIKRLARKRSVLGSIPSFPSRASGGFSFQGDVAQRTASSLQRLFLIWLFF